MDTSVTTQHLRGGAAAALSLEGLRRWWRSARKVRTPAQPPARDLIYRLRTWPELAEHQRTVDVYRMLSVMSSRPVNRSWVLSTTAMTEAFLDRLLGELVADGIVEVIDPAAFTAR